MVANNSIQLKDQLNIRNEREISKQMDSILLKMQSIAKEFKIADADKKSPFRNVLAVAVEPSSSLEVIKNYIRYQVGRKESSPIWKLKKGDKLFAEIVVFQIDSLLEDVQLIFQNIEKSLSQGDELLSYLKDSNNHAELKQELHLKLVQLYLGYLAREHTASVGESKEK